MTALEQPWALSTDAVVAALGVVPTRGLSAEQVATRRRLYGANTLRVKKRRSAWMILLAQFKSLLVALLAAALVSAALFEQWVEAIAVLVVLVVNALLGFFTELNAVRSVEALRQLGTAQVAVRRSEGVLQLPAAELVPGDIVLLEGGDVVTADVRLCSASKLQVNESALTGESLPVEKAVAAVDACAPLSERYSMLYKGTVVTRGSAEAVVVATGMRSELGTISRLVEETEDEGTPLERRLNQLGYSLVWATLVVAALVAVSGVIAGKSIFLVIQTSIALAVAAVPEGLPVIATIALARGVRRMARHNALVNRLAAVETLGATSIICTDKTGTLTENRMRVARLELVQPEATTRALETAALCNNATLSDERAGVVNPATTGEGVGDPLELALLEFAARDGILRSELLGQNPEVREVAFDSDVRMMATVHGRHAPYRVAVKGAPEAVLSCVTLSHELRAYWMELSTQLAAEGLRVIALAEGEQAAADEDVYSHLSLLGLVGLLDPPRPEVKGAIDACRAAGVRVVMVTGDHPLTATTIARATGLIDSSNDAVVLGAELDSLAALDEPGRARLRDASVFARVSPAQKLELIGLHQAAGSVVAMTGDGVNDAPALTKANIGVAMGQRGTAAAKEAASMVLKDDNFSTIVVAIREGRIIVDNIRTFVVYLLSCNLSEVLVVAAASAIGGPLPLLPLQILFLNLVTDVFPALALGACEGSADVMARAPHDSREPIVARRHWRRIVAYSVLMTMSVLAAFALALNMLRLSEREAVTVSFLTLALVQLGHVFNMRRGGGWVHNEVSHNRWIWAALLLCGLLLMMALKVDSVAEVLALTPPSSQGWSLVFVFSLLPLFIGQVMRPRRPPS